MTVKKKQKKGENEKGSFGGRGRDEGERKKFRRKLVAHPPTHCITG